MALYPDKDQLLANYIDARNALNGIGGTMIANIDVAKGAAARVAPIGVFNAYINNPVNADTIINLFYVGGGGYWKLDGAGDVANFCNVVIPVNYAYHGNDANYKNAIIVPLRTIINNQYVNPPKPNHNYINMSIKTWFGDFFSKYSYEFLTVIAKLASVQIHDEIIEQFRTDVNLQGIFPNLITTLDRNATKQMVIKNVAAVNVRIPGVYSELVINSLETLLYRTLVHAGYLYELHGSITVDQIFNALGGITVYMQSGGARLNDSYHRKYLKYKQKYIQNKYN